MADRPDFQLRIYARAIPRAVRETVELPEVVRQPQVVDGVGRDQPQQEHVGRREHLALRVAAARGHGLRRGVEGLGRGVRPEELLARLVRQVAPLLLAQGGVFLKSVAPDVGNVAGEAVLLRRLRKPPADLDAPRFLDLGGPLVRDDLEAAVGREAPAVPDEGAEVRRRAPGPDAKGPRSPQLGSRSRDMGTVSGRLF